MLGAFPDFVYTKYEAALYVDQGRLFIRFMKLASSQLGIAVNSYCWVAKFGDGFDKYERTSDH